MGRICGDVSARYTDDGVGPGDVCSSSIYILLIRLVTSVADPADPVLVGRSQLALALFVLACGVFRLLAARIS